ncbi:MAG: hypothetical protein CMN32_00425 [Saprospirales bacterium]|nr:hypothetical protein [Saprospirales bacterium]
MILEIFDKKKKNHPSKNIEAGVWRLATVLAPSQFGGSLQLKTVISRGKKLCGVCKAQFAKDSLFPKMAIDNVLCSISSGIVRRCGKYSSKL